MPQRMTHSVIRESAIAQLSPKQVPSMGSTRDPWDQGEGCESLV